MKNKILAMLLSFTLIFTTTGFSFADGDEATPAPEPEKKSEQVVEKKAEPVVEKKEVNVERVKVEAPAPEPAKVEQKEEAEEDVAVSDDKVVLDKEPAEVKINDPPAKLDDKAKMKEEKKPGDGPEHPEMPNFSVMGWTGYYDGNAHWVSITPANPGPKMYYEYKVDGVQNGWSRNIPDLIEVGDYPVHVRLMRSNGNGHGNNVQTAHVIIKEKPAPPAPKEIVITVNDAEKVYNAADPQFTAEVTPADAPKVKYDLVRKPGENVGKYTITAKVYGNNLPSNYTVVVKDGTLTINPVVLKVDDLKKVYGTEDPEFTATHNSPVKFQYSLYREQGEDVGDYAIKARVPDEKNYVVEEGTLTITPAEASVIFVGNHEEFVYDGKNHRVTGYHFDYSNPAYPQNKGDFSYDAFANKVDRVDVGTTEVVPENFVNHNKNFDVTFEVKQPLAVTITPAEYVLAINDATKVYGEDDPKFTAEWNGPFKIAYTLYRDAGEDVGKYKIKAKIGFDEVKPIDEVKEVATEKKAVAKEKIDFVKESNYKIVVKEGTFTITPKEIVITANDKSKMLGEVTPKFDETITGLDTQADRNWFEKHVTYTIACDYEEAVGDYPIVVAAKVAPEPIIIGPITPRPPIDDIERPHHEYLEEAIMEYAKEEVFYAKSVEEKKIPAEAVSEAVEPVFEVIEKPIAELKPFKKSNYSVKTVNGVFKIRDKVVPPVDPDNPDNPDNPVVGPTDNEDNTPGLGDGDSTVMKAKTSGIVQTGDKDACWALLNLILMITSCLIAFLVVLSRVLRRDEEYVDEPKSFFNNWFESIMSGVVAVFTAIVFFLTENMNTPMVWTDRWTVMMIVLFVLQLGVVAYVKFRDKIFEEDN